MTTGAEHCAEETGHPGDPGHVQDRCREALRNRSSVAEALPVAEARTRAMNRWLE